MRIPKSVKEAISLDKPNFNTLWWNVIVQEIKIVRIFFEIYEGNAEVLPPVYQEVSCHIIFGVNIRENFLRIYQIVVGGHNTAAPSSPNDLSVIYRTV